MNPSTIKSHIDEYMTLMLHARDDKKVEQLFYAADESVGKTKNLGVDIIL